MYGTVMRYRMKPGSEAAFQALVSEFRSAPPAGFVNSYTYRLDSGGDEYVTCAIFDGRADYTANANSPTQQAWYGRMRELMVGDPAWSDGEILEHG